MYRGTTPTFTFKINTDIDLSTLTACYITFKSDTDGKEKEYDLDHIIVDPEEKTLSIALSQEDTLDFPSGRLAVQIRLKTSDGLAFASNIKELNVDYIIKDGTI